MNDLASNHSGGLAPLPVRIAADLGRRFPSAWSRFDAARATRAPRAPIPPTWLTYGETLSALRGLQSEAGSDLPIEDVCDLYAFGTWRVTQGIYRFDPELLSALAVTPLNISLPASLLTRLPEWAVYVETSGLTHFGKPIAGMIASLFDAPSGLSLMMTLISESGELATADRLQFHVTDVPLRDRLLQDLGRNGFRRNDFKLSLDDIDRLHLPEPKAEELRQLVSTISHDMTQGVLDVVLSEIVPFISLLLYLCSEEPDMSDRQPLPTGKHTKRGVRFFPPPQPRIWPVGVRMGAALRAARATYEHTVSGGGRSITPHMRSAHFHLFWTGPRSGPRKARIRWIWPVPVNVRTDTELPAVIRPVHET